MSPLYPIPDLRELLAQANEEKSDRSARARAVDAVWPEFDLQRDFPQACRPPPSQPRFPPCFPCFTKHERRRLVRGVCMLKIARTDNGKHAVFAISGRIAEGDVPELQKVLTGVSQLTEITLDLEELRLA